MRLAFTSEQQELVDAVRRFCQDAVTRERLAAWEGEAAGIDAATWQRVADLGWLGLGVPVAAGGSGMGLNEIACVLQECGRGLIPRRVINAVRGGLALADLDPQHVELAALVRGARSVTLACDERNVRDPRRYATVVREQGGVASLSGEKWYVPDGALADLHLVAAREEGGVSIVLVERAAAAVVPLRSFDGSRQAVARYDGVAVERLTAPGRGLTVLSELRRRQQALALAEMVGGMDAVLGMTVAYVKEREQFGQKLAVFQAVQHQVADMATAFTAARHLAWQAISRLAAGTVEGHELATAAAFCGQAFKRLTLAAHHLHGGAGYVVEHPLHYHAERAQSLCIRYAGEPEALHDVAAALLDS